MKTKTEQATPRPWHVVPCGGEKYIGSNIGLLADMCREKCENEQQVAECDANAALIVQAVNEWEALNAVAEAAEQADCGCTVKERNSGHRSGCAMESLVEALAALSAIRAKEGK